MAWLTGWGKRVKLTIDKNDILAVLNNFPVLIYISSSSGRNGEDVTFIFDEVGVNSKKIAVTKSDGVTECYVEIEKWDFANEKAWLWAKIPNIESDVDTDIYLYYDGTHDDNVDYVGEPNSVPAENVWDNNFKFVSHMRDDPDTSHIRDSTNNNKDGTKASANNPSVTVDGKIDDAQDFSGDFINLASSIQFLSTDGITLEAWVKTDTVVAGEAYIFDRTSDTTQIVCINRNGDDIRIGLRGDNGLGITWLTVVDILQVGVWLYIVGIRDTSTDKLELYFNGAYSNGTTDLTSGNITPTLRIGRHATSSALAWDGMIDEVRVSNTRRSNAWIKASYETAIDNLLDWGTEEIPVVIPTVTTQDATNIERY